MENNSSWIAIFCSEVKPFFSHFYTALDFWFFLSRKRTNNDKW